MSRRKDSWSHHTGSALSPPFHECPSATCISWNDKPAPEVEASFHRAAAKFYFRYCCSLPSNCSADSAGQSFEYHSSFGSTDFDTGTKWANCVLVVATADVSTSNRHRANPTSSSGVPFFSTQYVYVCACTSLLYSFHFVFLISSFLLSLFVSLFLPTFLSFS
jgi:hypothetical protein